MFVGAAIDDALARSDSGHPLGWLAALAADFALLSLCRRFGARRAARLGIAHALRLAVVARVLGVRGMPTGPVKR